jgi:hypothetical protein
VWANTTKGHAVCWQCETRDDDIAEHLDEIRDAVRDHGWVIKCVDRGKRPYAYTTGLHQFGLPELIATGVTTEGALVLLDHFVNETMTNGQLRPGARLDFLGVAAIEVVEVDQPDAHLGLGVALYGNAIRAVQLVWTDMSGNWPWDSAFDDEAQPVLGVRAQAAWSARLRSGVRACAHGVDKYYERTCHVLAMRPPRINDR